MAYAGTPLTPATREAVRRQWGIDLDGDLDRQVERLPGGEESASYRVGSRVVRIGPTWRSDAELAWSYRVAAGAAIAVPEVIAAQPTRTRELIVRVEDRPVSVWPYVDGSWADHAEPDQQDQAAALLARSHRALADLGDLPPRPGQGDRAWRERTQPVVADAALDRWLAEFTGRRPARQALHGDVYRGNVLVRAGVIVALLDWDDVFLGPPEQELAWAAAEWGGVRETLRLEVARRFVDTYVDAGGTAGRIDEEELAQLIRGRIRMEVTYSCATGQWGASDEAEDREYEANQLAAFRALRP